ERGLERGAGLCGHAAAHRPARARRSRPAGGRDRGLRPPLGLVAVPRLHEDQHLRAVRELHPLGHPALHPHGRAGRALGSVDGAVSRRERLCRPFPRRAGDGGDRGLHGVRGDLRLLGRHHGHLRASGPAGVAALRLRRRLCDRHGRGRGHLGDPDPALGDPRRLRHLDRAEHRQAVHGGLRAGRHGGAVLLRGHLPCGAPPPGAGAPAREGGRRGENPLAAGRVADPARRPRGGRRHLWRRLHPDRGRGRGCHRHAAGRARRAEPGLGRDQDEPDPDRRNLGHDLHHPARRGGVQRLPGAVATADGRGRNGHEPRAASLCGDGEPSPVLHPARRRHGRAGHDPAHAAALLPHRLGARLRPPAGRAGNLVRHPGADRRRHRPHRPADRAQRLRGQRRGPGRADLADLPRRAALHRRRRGAPRALRRLSRVVADPGALVVL
ncbi:MAG: TRAP dicarboxylate transporter, DctM subunit, unknown substrate 3, partial [uncultured Microvirga sp.]